MECYSAIKMNELESVVVRWMNLDLLHRVKQVRKRKTSIVYYRANIMESRKMVPMNLFAG